MNTTHISATELKNNTSHVLNMVIHGKKIAIIKRHGKAVAKIVPIVQIHGNADKKSDEYFGSAPDFPDVVNDRMFTKKDRSL